jgi:hypothetical protein
MTGTTSNDRSPSCFLRRSTGRSIKCIIILFQGVTGRKRKAMCVSIMMIERRSRVVGLVLDEFYRID